MSAILIISVVLAIVASFAILRTTRRPRSNEDGSALPPFDGPRGLFVEEDARRLAEAAKADEEAAREDSRRSLLARAAGGDLGALGEAHSSGDGRLYDAALDALVTRASGDAARLRELAELVARGNDLRSSPALASALAEDWRRAPERAKAPLLMRAAALSGDADAFALAMDAVLRSRLEGRLADADAGELSVLFDAEYWLLPSEARRSGAGFRLKQKLAQVRRSLADHGRRRPTQLGPAAQAAGEAGQRERQ